MISSLFVESPRLPVASPTALLRNTTYWMNHSNVEVGSHSRHGSIVGKAHWNGERGLYGWRHVAEWQTAGCLHTVGHQLIQHWHVWKSGIFMENIDIYCHIYSISTSKNAHDVPESMPPPHRYLGSSPMCSRYLEPFVTIYIMSCLFRMEARHISAKKQKQIRQLTYNSDCHHIWPRPFFASFYAASLSLLGICRTSDLKILEMHLHESP